MNIFTEEFLRLPKSEIVKSIDEKGFYAFPKALTEEFVRQIEKDATSSRININKNEVTGVKTPGQYYFVNLLTKSQGFYNYLTSDLVKDVCFGYFKENFRLKALRYYETYGGFHMQWHTDNKTDMEFSKIPGLIFIFYVSDVAEGEFQYIEGSHNWSGHTAYNDYSDQYIEENHADAVRSFKYPKGSLVIYNTYGVHRAHPVKNRSFVRKSVFFQVDGDLSNSEPIIINTALHHKREEWVEKLLGFGLRGDYKVFPVTGIKGLPVMDYFKFVGLGSYSLLDRSLRYLIPVRYLRKIKMLLLKK